MSMSVNVRYLGLNQNGHWRACPPPHIYCTSSALTVSWWFPQSCISWSSGHHRSPRLWTALTAVSADGRQRGDRRDQLIPADARLGKPSKNRQRLWGYNKYDSLALITLISADHQRWSSPISFHQRWSAFIQYPGTTILKRRVAASNIRVLKFWNVRVSRVQYPGTKILKRKG